MIPKERTGTDQRVAVLMACHNRRITTLNCLESLDRQYAPGVALRTFLVDDGSQDGTADAVRLEHPDVHVIDGPGSLFWAGAMRKADQVAWDSEPDYLMWLNDDVSLEPQAIMSLVAVAKSRDDDVIVTGAVTDTAGVLTYGGQRHQHHGGPFDFDLVEPSGEAIDVDVTNGNVVLVPAAIRSILGPLDPRFSHNMADFDYALRARRRGVRILLAPSVVGTCSANESKRDWARSTTPLRGRVSFILSPKGAPPGEWLAFTRRHGGRGWWRYFLAPYVRALLGARPDGP